MPKTQAPCDPEFRRKAVALYLSSGKPRGTTTGGFERPTPTRSKLRTFAFAAGSSPLRTTICAAACLACARCRMLA